MKKVLLTLCAVSLCFASMAQLSTLRDARQGDNSVREGAPKPLATKTVPTWTPISQHVSGINFLDLTQTISTQAIAASGKAMVIDYSATWCSWCWVMHTNSILEAIQDQLGSQVQCIWVEADPSTNSAGITGGGNSQGNWTMCNGTPVNYPIIDDPAFANLIGGTSAIEGFPTVVFVSPSGYWCSLYGESWGFGPYSASDAVSAIQTILTQMPQANVAPVVAIDGPNRSMVNIPLTFTASIVSVDSITDITWTATGGSPATGNSESFTTTFATAGTYTITLSVTNTTGTTTESITVNIRDGWAWGDEMDYTDGGDFVSAIGLQSGAEFEWGILYPANLLSGRNYVTKVSAYINQGATGTYTVRIYQGGTAAPATLLSETPFNITQSGQYVDMVIPGGVSIDQTQNMWVTISSSGYVAAYTDYNGDPNSDLITLQNSWHHLPEFQMEGTWMIKTTTSANAPDFDFIINGPASLAEGAVGEFSIAGDPTASYNWTLTGANPASATGTSVSASWATAGNYTITVAGTRASQNVTKTFNVEVRSCAVTSLPWNEGFENGLGCWSLVDADGDGYGWMDNSGFSPRTGNGAVASASFINNIGSLTPDNWMISPLITIPAEGATLAWYDYAQDRSDFAEHYTVYFSATGNQPNNFTSPLASITVESGQTWKLRNVNIPGGQNGYIAFRHHDCTNMYWLRVDDLSLTSGQHAGINDVNNISVKVYPNPATEVINVHAEALRQVNVIDVNGRVVLTTNNSEVNISNLATGVYFVRVITDNGTAMEKIVKE